MLYQSYRYFLLLIVSFACGDMDAEVISAGLLVLRGGAFLLFFISL